MTYDARRGLMPEVGRPKLMVRNPTIARENGEKTAPAACQNGRRKSCLFLWLAPSLYLGEGTHLGSGFRSRATDSRATTERALYASRRTSPVRGVPLRQYDVRVTREL